MADTTETFKFRLPLRQIAKALGKVEKELDAIRMTVPQLQELIKQDVPNIAEMSYEDVQALAANVTSGNRPAATPAPAVASPKATTPEPVAEPEAEAAPAPAKRGPGRPPKPKTSGSSAPVSAPAPIEEVVEETPVATEEPVLPKAMKVAPKAPLRRGPALVAAPVTETQFAAAAPATVDLGPVLVALEDLRKRIDVIGQQSDLINTSVKDLNARVKRVEDAFGTQDDRISAIVGALSFLYATTSGDQDGESIENIDWSQFLN